MAVHWKQVANWLHKGGFCGRKRAFWWTRRGIDGIGQKIGTFLGRDEHNDSFGQEKAPFSGRKGSKEKRDTPKGCLRNKHIITRRFSAAALASARCSQNIEAAMPPDPNEVSGRCAPDRGCLSEAKTGVEIVAKKKPGGKPGEFFACYKRNKFIC